MDALHLLTSYHAAFARTFSLANARRSAGRCAAAAALATATASLAHADLVQYSFTDPYGASKALQPSSQYLNAVGNISFSLSGGLSRTVRVTLLAADGTTVIGTASSAPLGASDIIQANGATYYGAALTLPAPPEGTYTVKADLLSSAGDVVSTNTYPLVEDVTPPTAGQWVGEGYGICNNFAHIGTGTPCPGIPDNAMIGPTESQMIAVSGVTDNLAGVASATFTSLSADGKSTYYTLPATYGASQQTVAVGNGQSYSITSGKVFPAADGPVIAQFDIVDKAGNKTTVRKPLKWNGIGLQSSSWSVAGVYNPSSSNNPVPGSPYVGYDTYVAGMQVHTNPVKLLVRINANQWIGNNEYGIYITGTGITNPLTPDYRDSDGNVYRVVSGPYGGGVPNTQFTDATFWSIGGVSYNLTLAPDVAPSPIVTARSFTTQELGTVTGAITGSDFTVTGAQVSVQARPYNQVIKTSYGSCTVLAGATGCSTSGSWKLSAAAGKTFVTQPTVTAFSSDSTLFSNTLLAVFVVDKIGPSITTASFNQKTGVVTASGAKSDQGQAWGLIKMSSASVTATATSGTYTKTFPAALVVPGDGTFSMSATISGLPQGAYDYVVQATDSAGNVASKDLGTYTIDTAPPVVSTSITNGTSIKSIDDVLVGVTDTVDPAPKLTTANLQGGLAGVNVNLAFSQDAQGKFHLQYPALASTLNLATGQYTPYILTLGATDASGNIGTTTVSFNYTPPQVVLTNPQGVNANVPAIAPPGTPVTDTVQSAPITLGDGSTLSGVYPVQATLRADSPGPVSIGGVTLQPGQTQTISSYDFGGAGGRLSFPVSAPAAGTSGAATLYLSTTAPNAPLGVATVTVWDPSTELARCAPAITLSNVGGGLDGEPLNAQASWSMQAAQNNGACTPFLAWLSGRAAGATLLDVSVGLTDSKGTPVATLSPSQPINSFTGRLSATGTGVLPAGTYTVKLAATWAAPILQAFGLSSALPVNAVQAYTLACPAPTLLGAQPQSGTNGTVVLALVHLYQCNGVVSGTLALAGARGPIAGKALADPAYTRTVPLNRIAAYAFDLTGAQVPDGMYQGNFAFVSAAGGNASAQLPVRIEAATAIPLATPTYNGADLTGQSVPSFAKVLTTPTLPPAYSVVIPASQGSR
ncbi:DUF4165 domain-containing protein [Burkholderia sp. MBR-1]|uniref:DUF4165 domain-containing protein n=1 Tax=Burkholderia sp. MBR-1 TaxID=2732364 RepID=UPI0015EECC08|nr:DUF4165 domain-containing protein [Burkholderia sp. MBR-1]QMI49789.1 DUF4165 domain-containing protein [Burkholderia sp. MBR-1]